MGMVALRRRIGSAFFVVWGQYGEVSEFAQQQGVSRQWVYREAKQVTDTLEGGQARADLERLQKSPYLWGMISLPYPLRAEIWH